jgi:DNA-binding NtrC family response regulator
MSDQARVLVVERTPTRLEVARAALEAAGYSVRSASPDTALATAREWRPDAVFIEGSVEKCIEAIAAPAILPLAVTERRAIEAALRQTDNDVPRAAAMLEINPSTIYRKLQLWRSEA